jgi:hypothetical protein
MRNHYCLKFSHRKVVNRSKREYRGSDVKENFFLNNRMNDNIGSDMNNASIGSEANSNIAPPTAK